jgi:hypothetical protein
MTGYNMGMPGNTHVDAVLGQPLTVEALATLAAAFEQRTANLIAYAALNPEVALTEGIDVVIRSRLGMPS